MSYKVINQKTQYIIKQLWINLLKSIKGETIDYTKISIKKSIFFLSVPMVLEMFMESIFAVVDIFFVAKLSPEAIATVGLTESIIILVYAIGGGLGIGISAYVARKVGEKKLDEASIYAAQGISLSFFISILISIVGIFFSENLLYLMGASDYIVQNYSIFTTIMLVSNATILLLFAINSIFRSSGNPVISMKVLVLANTLNIILDPILIFGLGPIPAMGIAGAAIATTIGRGIAVIYQIYILLKNKNNLNILISYFLPIKKKILKILKISVPGVGQILIITISWIVLTRIIAIFGSYAIAGYTVALRVFLFFILPAEGIANASATLVGQNLGAKNPQRAEDSVALALKIMVSLLTLLGLIMFLGAEYLIKLFDNTPEVIEYGIICIKIFAIGMPIYGFGMTYSRALNGAGDSISPTKINIISFWIIEIPLAYILAVTLDYGVSGVLSSVIVSELVMGILSFIVIKKGKWKLTQL